jgi:hypothetical protein
MFSFSSVVGVYLANWLTGSLEHQFTNFPPDPGQVPAKFVVAMNAPQMQHDSIEGNKRSLAESIKCITPSSGFSPSTLKNLR